MSIVRRPNARITAALVAGAVAVAAPVTMQWEGVSLRVYKDRLAYNIPTYCYGETEDVDFSKTYTIAECGALLRKKLPRYTREIAMCITGEISATTLGAFTVTAYNIGTAGFCNSSMAWRWNAGDRRGACDALLMWTKAGGQFRQGLLNRRRAERALCLEGLKNAG